MGSQRNSPAAYPREPPGTHCIGGWVGPRTGQDGCGKSRPPPGFDPRTVQPVASRYTDWAIPARRTGSFVKFCAFMTYIWKICVKNYTGVHFLNAQQHRRGYKLDERVYNKIGTRLPCTEYTLYLWREGEKKAKLSLCWIQYYTTTTYEVEEQTRVLLTSGVTAHSQCKD